MSTKRDKLRTTNRKTIQIILILLGFVLIATTYFIYPRLIQIPVQKKIAIDEDLKTEEATTFTNVEYKGITNDGSPYIVSSEYASIVPDDADMIFMTFVTARYHYKDGRTVTITSDEGLFNKVSGDINFKRNVKMIDGDNNKLTSDNLDMLVSKDYAMAYNNVEVLTDNGQFAFADQVKFDALKKTLRISMNQENKKVKLKLIK